jgi:hypothetical protein
LNKIEHVDCSTPEKTQAYVEELVKGKGKNFSANNTTGLRREADGYQTPYSLTRLFLDSMAEIDPEAFSEPNSILEPAQGQGAIVKVLQSRGFDPVAYDVETDFLTESMTYNSIITNPPYSLSMPFIEKAMQVASHEFAFLFPLSYLQGYERFSKLWSRSTGFRLKRVSVINRFSFLGDDVLWEDGKHRTGMIAYAWFYWCRDFQGYPTLHHLDVNPYILSAAEYRERMTLHYMAQGLGPEQIEAIFLADRLSKKKAKEAAPL